MRVMPGERRLVIESPEVYKSGRMQAYIAQEATRPCKQWVHEVLSSKREVERVKLRTDNFVLLPDVDTINKRPCSRLVPYLTEPQPLANDSIFSQCLERRWRPKRLHPPLHWLALLTDTNLKTVRDLRGRHIPMLQQLNHLCCQKIQEETGIQLDQIMAYVHYPPSVYQLHIHFKHPVGPHVSHDTFRIHSLASIINNLKIDTEYYAKSLLQLPVYPCTELYLALGLDSGDEAVTEDVTDPQFLCPHCLVTPSKKCLKLQVRKPKEGSDLPNREQDLPNREQDLPNREQDLSNREQDLPNTELDLPNTELDFIRPSLVEKALPSPGPTDPDPCSPPTTSTSPGSRQSTPEGGPGISSPSAT